MLTECAVVGTDAELSGMQDYLIDGNTGFVSNNNFEDFVESIEALIEDKNTRLELGANGRKKILSIGDRKKNMSEFVNILERI
jgi:glycosyltransferase involved in cell wall biosynthesis